MGKSKVDWSKATPEQIDRGLRAWKIRFAISAGQYAVVAAVTFWLGLPILGAAMIIVGVVGTSVGLALHPGEGTRAQGRRRR